MEQQPKFDQGMVQGQHASTAGILKVLAFTIVIDADARDALLVRASCVRPEVYEQVARILASIDLDRVKIALFLRRRAWACKRWALLISLGVVPEVW